MRMTITCRRDAYIKPNNTTHLPLSISPSRSLSMYIPLFPQRREQTSSIWGPPAGRRLYDQQGSQADVGGASPYMERPSLSGYSTAPQQLTQRPDLLLDPEWNHRRDDTVFWEVQRRFNETFPLTTPGVSRHAEAPSNSRKTGVEHRDGPEMAEDSTVRLAFACGQLILPTASSGGSCSAPS
jgi:hypothetical protein